MRRVDKSMVEVLQMSKETRDKWMQQVKGKEYSTTQMDDYYDVGESQPRAPKEKTAALAKSSKKKYQDHDNVQETAKWRAKRQRDGGE